MLSKQPHTTPLKILLKIYLYNMPDFRTFRSDNDKIQKNGGFIKDFDGWNTEKKIADRSK